MPVSSKIEPFIQSEFALSKVLIYLNHAAVAPWPLRTQQAVQAFAEENACSGALHYPKWLEREKALKQLLAKLINAPAEGDIALLKNTSEALSVVAHGIDWQPGDTVVICDQEFPSNRIVWESLADRRVVVREVDLNAGDSPEAALMAATDENTRLLAISSVQYASGLRIDLEVLGAHCRQHDILFCVDAIQSIGALQMDVQAIQADFVMADGHKWMLGPEGIALFYCRPELRDQLALHQYGWHMIENMGDFEQREWELAHSARRFECGSPNMLGIFALHASISLLLDVGLEQIEQRILANSKAMFEFIQNSKNLELITSPIEGQYAGIVGFRHRQIDNERLFKALWQQGIVCALRGGGVRFSPHFYTPQKQIHRALEYADNCCV